MASHKVRSREGRRNRRLACLGCCRGCRMHTAVLVGRSVCDLLSHLLVHELARVIDPHELLLVAAISSQHYGRVKPGMEIAFSTGYLKEAFKTRVESIVPLSTRDDTFEITAAVPNLSGFSSSIQAYHSPYIMLCPTPNLITHIPIDLFPILLYRFVN